MPDQDCNEAFRFTNPQRDGTISFHVTDSGRTLATGSLPLQGVAQDTEAPINIKLAPTGNLLLSVQRTEEATSTASVIQAMTVTRTTRSSSTYSGKYVEFLPTSGGQVPPPSLPSLITDSANTVVTVGRQRAATVTRSAELQLDSTRSTEGFERQADGTFIKREYYRIETEEQGSERPSMLQSLLDTLKRLSNEQLWHLHLFFLHKEAELQPAALTWVKEFLQPFGQLCDKCSQATVWQYFFGLVLRPLSTLCATQKQTIAELETNLQKLPELTLLQQELHTYRERIVVLEKELHSERERAVVSVQEKHQETLTLREQFTIIQTELTAEKHKSQEWDKELRMVRELLAKTEAKLNVEREEFHSRNEDLATTARIAQDRAAALQRENEALIERYEKHLSITKEKFSKAGEAELQVARERVQKLEAELANWQTQLRQAREQATAAEQALQEHRLASERNAHLARQSQEAEHALRLAMNEINQRLQRTVEIQQRLGMDESAQIRDSLTIYEERIERLQAELRLLNERPTSGRLEVIVGELEAERRKAAEQYRTCVRLESECNQLRAELRQCTQALDDKIHTERQLQSQLTSAHRLLESNQVDRVALENKVRDLLRQLQSLEDRPTNSSLDAIRRELEWERQQSVERQTRCQEYDVELSHLRIELQRTKLEFQDKLHAEQQLVLQLSAKSESVERLQQERRQIEDRIREFQQIIQTLEDRPTAAACEALRKELEWERHQHNELKERHIGMDAELLQLRAELQSVRHEVEERLQVEQHLQIQVRTHGALAERAADDRKALEDRIRELQRQVHMLEERPTHALLEGIRRDLDWERQQNAERQRKYEEADAECTQLRLELQRVRQELTGRSHSEWQLKTTITSQTEVVERFQEERRALEDKLREAVHQIQVLEERPSALDALRREFERDRQQQAERHRALLVEYEELRAAYEEERSKRLEIERAIDLDRGWYRQWDLQYKRDLDQRFEWLEAFFLQKQAVAQQHFDALRSEFAVLAGNRRSSLHASAAPTPHRAPMLSPRPFPELQYPLFGGPPHPPAVTRGATTVMHHTTVEQQLHSATVRSSSAFGNGAGGYEGGHALAAEFASVAASPAPRGRPSDIRPADSTESQFPVL
eukprot:TRINITY_DN67221_c0_g1_i1.p1 TRINITY_DN67221_c0_g1~~TRINITY_DN67221_c0_g1_i1.p1  ORF type:complete len:1168 (-),score=252.75 TRINITY_DN67221_c0_g1_i1:148-3525(-)